MGLDTETESTSDQFPVSDSARRSGADSDEEDRVFVKVGRNVEWLCAPRMVTGWRTTAGGAGSLMDNPVRPS
jgi:hypothetical protein